jgi:hypothetical protein
LVGGLIIWAFALAMVQRRRAKHRALVGAQVQEDLDRYWRIREGRPYLEDLGF